MYFGVFAYYQLSEQEEYDMYGYDAASVEGWQEIDKINGWLGQQEGIALQEVIRQLEPKAQIAELGSWQGRSSVVIASALPPEGTLYCVDHFKGSDEHQGGQFDLASLYDNFSHNIKKFHVEGKIQVLVMSSLDAAAKFATSSLDLVFVDASHDYESVKADIEHWYPKLKEGGFLVCHDYPWCIGVQEGVKALKLDGELVGGSLWLHQR